MPLKKKSFYQLNFRQDWWAGYREYWFWRGVSKSFTFLLIFTHSDPEAQPRGGPKADISETFRSTVRGCGGRAPTNHPFACLQGTKSHKECAQGLRKSPEIYPRIIRIPTSVKSWFLQTLSNQMTVFSAPYFQILTNKNLKK